MTDTFTLSAEGPNSVALIRLALSGFDADRLPVESLEISLGMSDPSKGVSLEFTGDDIFDDASEHLSFYDTKAVDTLHVGISFTEDFDATQIPSTPPALAGSDDSDESDDTATIERLNDQRSDTSIPPDVPGRISENTLGHLTLWLAYRCLSESTRPLTINELAETTGVSRGRIGSQMSKIYREKGLFSRQRHSTESGGYEYYYSLNEDAKTEAERLGAPDRELLPIDLPENLGPDSETDESEESGS